MNQVYHIGEYYKYPGGTKRFALKMVRGFWFYFECGHHCSDSVFMDLINVKTGVQVYKDIQYSLLTPPTEQTIK